VRTNQTFAISGTHFIYVMADYASTVAETNENNNVKLATIQVGTPPPQVDAYEADDTCPTAKPITTDGAPQQHNLDATTLPDQDWVKFEAQSGETFRIKGAPLTGDASDDLDLAIEVHSSSSDPANCPGSFGGSGTEFDFTAPTSGTYYLRMAHNQSSYGPKTAYHISVAVQGACSGSFEPNNTCQTATELVTNGEAQTHNFCQQGDRDWFRVPVAAGATYVITETNMGVQADAEVAIFEACTDVAAAGSGQKLEYTSPVSGYVYLRVESQNAALNGPNTNYTMQVSQKTSGCPSDSFETDNSTSAASTLTLNTPQQHNICPPGDVDWMKFTATPGVTYTLETSATGSKSDPVLCLYDTAGAVQLLCNDDNGPGKGARIVWQAPTAGTFFVQARDFDTSIAGPDTGYTVRISDSVCQPDSAEPDNTRAAAKSIATDGTPQTRNICKSGDDDWVSFNANATAYGIHADSLGKEADTVLELYDGTGKRLAFNDDFAPGTSALLGYTFTTPGTYYIHARHYNTNTFGTGTEYSLFIKPEVVTVPNNSNVVNAPGGSGPSQPNTTGSRTLILVNLEKVSADANERASLLAKLEQLANHASVKGEVIRLENNTTVKDAYAAWAAAQNDVSKANQVAAAIRGVVMTYIEQKGGLDYLVLIGSDDWLPFRRVPDGVNQSPEAAYGQVDGSNPTGAALRANNYLTDDYFADREPTKIGGGEMYVPDFAVGRLPGARLEIMGFIDQYLLAQTTTVNKVLVTGWDFVDDSAQLDCDDWKAVVGQSKMDCSAIGQAWTLPTFQSLLLSTGTKWDVQNINGHAAHFAQEAADKGKLKASEVKGAPAGMDYRGILVYTPGCHAGLQVPNTNSVEPTDLPDAYFTRGANYVANTGYGYGIRNGVALSEKMMRLYTQELLKGGTAIMGQALTKAKARYIQEDTSISAYDQKVVQQLIFYGLPMYKLQTSITGTLGDENDFPSADFVFNLSNGTFGDTVITGTASIIIGGDLGTLGPSDILTEVTPADGFGTYYALNNSTHADVGQPVQPLFFGNVTGNQGRTARSVLFKGGQYEVVNNFDPVIVSPLTSDFSTSPELTFTESLGWFPAVPVALQTRDGRSILSSQLGQYDPNNRQARLYKEVDVEMIYSLSTDVTQPEVLIVDGLYNPTSNRVEVKVGATDSSGIQKVVASYTQDTGNTGTWSSIELKYDSVRAKWGGNFKGGASTRFYVSVVDGAGNVTVVTNKGQYFVPGITTESLGGTGLVFLPLVRK
jgi:hypothetical protein